MKKRQHVYIDMDIVESIRNKARELGMTYSELVDVALRYYLYKNAELYKERDAGDYTVGNVLERLIMENRIPILKTGVDQNG